MTLVWGDHVTTTYKKATSSNQLERRRDERLEEQFGRGWEELEHTLNKAFYDHTIGRNVEPEERVR